MSKEFNWDEATKMEIFAHKEAHYSGAVEAKALLAKVEPTEEWAIPNYIDDENNVYVVGGTLYKKNAVFGYISNHLTMKKNIDITLFEDGPMKYGEWTKKEFILSKLKNLGVGLYEGNEVVQTYAVTPELTEEQSVLIATGAVNASVYDSEVLVYQVVFAGLDLLVHVIGDTVYFIEELKGTDEEVDTNEEL